MRIAINGYFWGQPRIGSGQYLRHLWDELSYLVSEGSTERASLMMLLPPGSEGDTPVPTRPGVQALRARPTFLAGKTGHLDKLAWEQIGAPRQAYRHHASLLHVPYLAAPIVGRVPTVVTAHDMIPWVLPDYACTPAVRLYLAVAAAGVKRARVVMADSEASRRDVIRFLRVPPGRVGTVHLGVERHPAFTQSQLHGVRARFGLPPSFAFYIGGFDRRKNVPLLLRAWKSVVSALEDPHGPGERAVLAIAGAVPSAGGIFPDVKGEALRLGLGDAVRFLGRVSEEDKPLLMAAARIFAYPSAYEGFGLDPLEAMSVGCAVVSSSGGSLREVVGDAGLLVPPDDEAALSAAITRAWNDDALRERLGAAGVERASRFTWQRTAEQTMSLYERAVRRRRGD